MQRKNAERPAAVICEALGLDPRRVTWINLGCTRRGVVVSVGMLVPGVEPLAKALKRYSLTEVGADEDVNEVHAPQSPNQAPAGPSEKSESLV